ncbi:MAG: amino acid adenylation domain-containing protein [Deltaproteobacteria bacterium]|nr:amino acid adenylation domain-containing protein [Deltaproteobacteria bacterium]
MDRSQVQDIYELSPMQKGMLFHSLLDPEAGLYIEQFRGTLQGDLEVSAFRQAWRETLERHPVLRTSFHWEDLEKPLQVVFADGIAPVEFQDWTSVALSDVEDRLEELARKARLEPFDLAKAPLMRAQLIRLGNGTHVFCWTYHHLLLDGWSLSIVLGELLLSYQLQIKSEVQGLERVGNEPVGLEPVRLEAGGLEQVRPFGDYIGWLQGLEMDSSEAYWRRQLQGVEQPARADWGGPVPEQPVAAADLAEATLQLPDVSAEKLRSFSATWKLTPSTLTHGIWAFLLARYGGQGEALFGSVVSGRPGDLPGADRMVGLFINTLPIRVPLDETATLTDWLVGLQESLAEAWTHSHSSLADVQRYASIPPGEELFESLLVFENFPPSDSYGEDTGLELVDPRFFERTHYPLTLECGVGEHFYLRLLYDKRRFSTRQGDRLLGHFGNLLQGLLEQPTQRLAQWDLYSEEEHRQLLSEHCGEIRPLPLGGAWGEAFEAQVTRTPNAIAVRDSAGERSYQQLADEAGALAGALQQKGVGRDSVVGLLGPRGIDFLVAMLAVFRAGASYLPLDPRHPSSRWAQALERGGARWVLAAEGERQRLAEVLDLDETKAETRALGVEQILPLELSQLELPQVEGPEIQTAGAVPGELGEASGPDSPLQLAYVLFTSGSTGVPKGAMVTQEGMVNHLWAKIRDLNMGPGDVVAQTASQSFDISVWQFLAALLVGGRVEIFADDVAFDAARLFAATVERSVTVLETVPSLLRESLMPGRPTLDQGNLQWLLSTGEALPPDLAADWLDRYPEIPLVNAYGPTECSDDVTHEILRKASGSEERVAETAVDKGAGKRASKRAGEGADLGIVPIGRCLPNLSLYVLDQGLRPVPRGAVGELLVGGIGVGRGYRREPALTARTFVPDLFSEQPGGRLYRTGDLVRTRAAGSLEFLGRRDHQVKIRGHRIEPGEAEAALRRMGFADCAVVPLKASGRQDWQLVAYVVPSATGGPKDSLADSLDEGAVAEALRGTLPDFLVPAAFLELPALPLNANGKLDRAALPTPEAFRETLAESYLAPRSATEARLAELWSEVLAVDRVGIRDNFFELGGHSLLAMRLVSSIGNEYGVEVPLRALFDQPTIEAFHSFLTERDAFRPDGNLADLLTEVESLSEEELDALLEEEERGQAAPQVGTSP